MPANPPTAPRADSARPWHDFYRTPPEATEALLRAEIFLGDIWEPACGDGAIARPLSAAGFTVRATDLVDRGYGEGRVDFLLFPARQVADNVVTNPPYRLAEEFLLAALGAARHKVALLLRLAFLEGIKRKALFEASPLARVHVFSRRLSMFQPAVVSASRGTTVFAWFVWEHGHRGPPTLHWC